MQISTQGQDVARGPDEYRVCGVGLSHTGRMEADARLIAAAPDLLEALRSVLDRPDTAESYDAMMARVQAAIAKAVAS